MNKNIKRMFFVTTLLILLVSITALSAADVSNDTSSNSQQNVVKEVNVEKVSDNTMTDTSTKNIKKEEQTTDLYVSDSSGSDDNSGTNTSPYKTIQKALDTTNADSTFNIHIAEGTYKGLGNTNLTVNGNNIINLIGEGINKTILDGGASYTIQGGDVWGSDENWNAYRIQSGNWGLNITKGNGLITISGLNIQNMVSRGGSSIDAYETATVDNYGNLVVDTVYFKNNLAGVGAGIRSNEDSSLIVNNSIFIGNRKSSSTGNFGAGIYNKGTAVVENTEFINNLARWGTVTNDKVLNITNCTFRDGISYDLGSTFKYGSGIAIDSGSADYFNPYASEGLSTNIQNCTFINNGQTDVYQATSGSLIINNSVFQNSSGIYINQNNTYNSQITNSVFTDMNPSTLFGDLSSDNTRSFAVYQRGSANITIENNTISVKDKKSNAIDTTGYALITNNTIYNQIKVESNSSVIQNIINTTSDYAINLNGRSNTVRDNVLESLIFYGNDAVLKPERSIVENNTPEGTKILAITDKTYSNYFDENSNIRDNITDGSALYISGEIKNKVFNFNNDLTLSITGYPDSILTNCQINLNGPGIITIRNITMNTTNPSKEYQVLFNSTGDQITYSRFYANTTGKIHNIIFNNDVNTFNYNNITTYGPSNNINYDSNNYGIADTISILINGSNNTINRNTINMSYTSTQNYGTIEAISIQSPDNSIGENKLQNNNINMTSDEYGYAINLLNTFKNTITSYNIYMNGSNYAYGVQLAGNTTENKVSGTISHSLSETLYGVIIDGYIEADNNDISSTNINNNNVTNLIGIDINNANNTKIQSINIYAISALNSTLMNIQNSNNNTISQNTFSNIKSESIRITADNITNSTLSIATPSSLDINNSDNIIINGTRITKDNGTGITINNSKNIQITPTFNSYGNINTQSYIITNGTGIYVENSDNITIATNNTINSTEDTIIFKNTTNSIVKENYLLKNMTIGGDTTINTIDSENITIENNIPDVIYITDDNYNNYFTDGIFNIEDNNNTLIHIASDLYNKNLTFNVIINLYGNNYTVYNGSINLKYTSFIRELNFNSTDNRETIINMTSSSYLYNSTVYHESSETIRTIINGYIDGVNMTVKGVEQEIEDNQPSIQVFTDSSVSNSNINLTTTSPTNTGYALLSDRGISYSNISMDGYNILVADIDSGIGTFTNNNILAVGKNSAKWINTSKPISASYNNVTIKSTNAYGITEENIYTRTTGALTLTRNNLTILGNQTGTIISYINITQSQGLLTTSINNIYGENVNGIIIDNYVQIRASMWGPPANFLDIEGNNITINNTLNTTSTPVIINNTLKCYYFTSNNISSNSNGAAVIIENSENMTIQNNYIISNNLKGNSAVKTTNTTRVTVNSNTPGVILTDDNYKQYFKNGVFIGIDDIELGSDLHNKILNFINKTVTIRNPNNYTIYNSTFKFENSNSTITNLNINYEGNNTDLITVTQTGTITIHNNNINMNGDNNTVLLIENTTYTRISQNNITVNTNTTNQLIIVNATRFSAIYIMNNNKICVNNTYENNPFINTTIPTRDNYIQSLDLTGNDAIVTDTGALIQNNTPTTTYMAKIYTDTSDSLINGTENTIQITITDVFQNPITEGTLYIKLDNQTSVTNIQEETTTITLTPTTTGEQTLTISLKSDKYTADNITIPVTVKLQAKISNITIPDEIIVNHENNITITTTNDEGEEITGIITLTDDETTTTSDTKQITYTPTTTGEKTLTITYTDPTGTYNTTTETINITVQPPTLTIDPITTTAGETINITARITARNQTITDINKGKITFKVNGKTLKDTSGKVIYAKVVNGTATIEDYLVPDDWAKDGTTIQAVYSGSTQCEKLTSEKTNITVNLKELTLTTTATTTQLTATLSDNTINTGKIVFKINGKTVKDAKGKVIYAKVVNGTVSVDYTLPESYKAGNYTVTATFIASGYDRLVANTTLTVEN